MASKYEHFDHTPLIALALTVSLLTGARFYAIRELERLMMLIKCKVL